MEVLLLALAAGLGLIALDRHNAPATTPPPGTPPPGSPPPIGPPVPAYNWQNGPNPGDPGGPGYPGPYNSWVWRWEPTFAAAHGLTSDPQNGPNPGDPGGPGYPGPYNSWQWSWALGYVPPPPPPAPPPVTGPKAPGVYPAGTPGTLPVQLVVIGGGGAETLHAEPGVSTTTQATVWYGPGTKVKFTAEIAFWAFWAHFDHWEGPGGVRLTGTSFETTVDAAGYVRAVFNSSALF